MEKLRKRKIFSKVSAFIDDKEAIVIHGARQVGKTYFLRYLIENNLKVKFEESNIFYLDLEDFRLLELCNRSCEEVITYLKAKGADFNKRIFLIIDEIQYLHNPSSFLKLFFDRYSEKVKLIVSGSSSFLIKKKFKNSLAGRIIDFELFPLDFEEFLEFKDLKYNLEIGPPEAMKDELTKLYAEFVIYGGYPAIVLEENIEKKEVKLKQIINTYIKKDIRDLAEIREVDKFNALLQILASQIGNLLNIFELSSTVGLAKKTIEEYLFLLENTYIIRRIKPFHKNIRSELAKMPKIFFEDTGLANILANKTFLQKLEGSILENSIYSQLRKNFNVDYIYFWRTNIKQEIDFIVDMIEKNKVNKLTAIEVKNIFLNKYGKNLNYFFKHYPGTKKFFCCLERKENPKDRALHLIYPWQLLFIIER
ncbi:MAG: ATP-binding protein [Candidatus Omnitrophota bacterium]